MGDLIVNDADYESISAAYKELGSYFEETITDYIAILDKICADGVTSGNVHDNLVIFKIYASLLSGQFEAMLGMASRICTDFVADIDVADCDLY